MAVSNWRFQAGAAGKPAVLLFHGNGNTGEAWTKPTRAAPAIPGLPSGYLDFRHTPDDRRIGEDHGAPNAGLYKIGHSDALDPDAGNWWDFLVAQDFTVATWDQDGPRFAEAYASAKDAFAEFHAATVAMTPPPPIALVGHSRGGLLIRKLLKEDPVLPGVERVRWVITFHSPHHGSDMARAYSEIGAEVVDVLDRQFPPSIPSPFGGRIPLTAPVKAECKKVVVELLRPLNAWWMPDNNRELVSDGPIVRDLARGEVARPGVRYHTFGGTTPTYFRMYAWLFDPGSAVPQYKVSKRWWRRPRLKQYFVWRVKAAEIAEVSPLLDRVRDFAPELEPGSGDGFVTDRSARLPFSAHETMTLNHMEVLWDRGLQQRVLGILTAAS